MTSEARADWKDALGIYFHRRPLTLLFLGFSSGLPYLLVFGTLSLWLREAGVDRSTIGFISWVTLVYAFKWVWAPLVDGVRIPLLSRLLGRRRGWLLVSQLAVIAGLVGMASSDPAQNLGGLVWLALLVAFAAATQDVVIDAYRIESGGMRLQAAMAATYMIGYRLGWIAAGAGVLWLAAWADPSDTSYEQSPWRFAYLIMAGLMGVGVVTGLFSHEPQLPPHASSDPLTDRVGAWLEAKLPTQMLRPARWLWRVVINPFVDFFRRYRWLALLVLALIASYRISDIVLGVIANVFYLDMGFTKTQIANVTKVFGVIMTLVGALAGGVLVNRLGVMRILFAGALLSAATNLLFALLAKVGASVPMLIGVVSMDNLSGGLATAAFVAYLSALTNVRFSATQYALFSSVMILLPKFVGGFSGVLVDHLGYETFFTLTALMGLPVLLLVWLAARYTHLEGNNGDA
jgi:PAT family beta-lactamase induction signal transducer AmpG